MNGPDDERLHRGEGDLIEGAKPEPEPAIEDVLPPPISNADVAAKAASVRAQRGQTTEEEQSQPIEARKQFTGSIPPPPPPPGAGRAKAITTADEPDGAPGAAESGEGEDEGESGEDEGEEAGAGAALPARALATPPPIDLPVSDESSWLAPRNEGTGE